jgi:DNA-binding transcriptional MerR regulator
MRISELSQLSQVPVATIKFYIREGLLPAGQRTSKNQADYGPQHIERLGLIRALQEAAGLRIDTIARALRAADTTKEDFVVAAIDALERPALDQDIDAAAFREVERGLLEVSKRRGWKVSGDDASMRDAVLAVVRIKRWFEPDADYTELEPYFDAVERIANHEIPDAWAPDMAPEAALRYAMLGTVLFEPFILALRRMAHVARSRAIQGAPAGQTSAAAQKASTKKPARTAKRKARRA